MECQVEWMCGSKSTGWLLEKKLLRHAKFSAKLLRANNLFGLYNLSLVINLITWLYPGDF